MDKLLALVAEAGDEEDVVIRLTDATWSGTSLQLHVAVNIFDSAQEIWEVRCKDVLAYCLRNEIACGLELTDDHPLLWEFKHERASAYFYRAPLNADAAVGALYEAHQNTVGCWIRFEQHLNNSPGLAKLLVAGNGLLAEGPVPLLTLYKETLRPHGSRGRYSLLASSTDLGWNSLAAIGAEKRHKSAAIGRFLRDWQQVGR